MCLPATWTDKHKLCEIVSPLHLPPTGCKRELQRERKFFMETKHVGVGLQNCSLLIISFILDVQSVYLGADTGCYRGLLRAQVISVHIIVIPINMLIMYRTEQDTSRWTILDGFLILVRLDRPLIKYLSRYLPASKASGLYYIGN